MTGLTRILLAGTLLFLFSLSPVLSDVARPTFKTNIVAFEDNFIYDTPAEGSLVYRTEGTGTIRRQTGKNPHLLMSGRSASYIHPAQYDRPTLQLLLTVVRGEPGIAICHNGMKDKYGNANPSPGIEVVLREKDTLVRDLKTGRSIKTIPEAFPRNRKTAISVFWDFDLKILRVDLPKSSYQVKLPLSVIRKGGFALRMPENIDTLCRVYQIRVLWQDNRDLVLYDGYDSVYDTHGKLLKKIPPAILPEGLTAYATGAVDMKRERSLILMGKSDLSSDYPETFKGWAVRDLKTGKLDVLSNTKSVNGCIPFQGGGSMDGYWIMQSWNVPASTCWLDWNAYDRGDKYGFIKPYKVSESNGTSFVGYHDPGNALDGSVCRYLRIDQSWTGINRLTTHPNLAPYSPIGDIAIPAPTDPAVSHTGPAGMPTQFAVRDKDRVWYELWAYHGNMLHSQNRGYNLFTRSDDWEGPFYPTSREAAPYEDYANMAPSLLKPGMLIAPKYRFSPKPAGSGTCDYLSSDWLTWESGRYLVKEELANISPLPPFQILMDCN